MSTATTNGHGTRPHIMPGTFGPPGGNPAHEGSGLYQPAFPPPSQAPDQAPPSRVGDMARYETFAIEGVNRSREDVARREREVERLSHERRVEDLGDDVAGDIWAVVLEMLPGEDQHEGWVVRAHLAAMIERAWRKGFDVGRSDQDSPR